MQSSTVAAQTAAGADPVLANSTNAKMQSLLVATHTDAVADRVLRPRQITGEQ